MYYLCWNEVEDSDLSCLFQNGLWFGEDATLRRLPDPLREKCSRPLMLAADELDPHLKTSWTKVHELKEENVSANYAERAGGGVLIGPLSRIGSC